MLKKIRIAAAVFFIAAVTLLFLDYTGTLHRYLGWCAKIQFVPAVLALNFAVMSILILATLLFGRVYCSAICPLGIFQDAVSWKAGWLKKNQNRFSYRPAKKSFVIARFVILALFVLAAVLTAVFNVPAFAAFIEPYSAYGRVVSQIFGPIYQWGNNVFAGFAERSDSCAFYAVDVWMKGAGAFVVAIATFAIIGAFAWKSGRGYCNAVCPAGTVFGLLAKFSVMKPRINRENCVSCGLCAKRCKASCVDPVKKEIDYLRCVSCFNCLGSCAKGGLTYSASAAASVGKAVSPNTKGVS